MSASIAPLPLRGKLFTNEPLAHYTTWRVGGPAKRLYKPADLNDLQQFIMQTPNEEPLLWLGLGSNSLIKDSGFQGTVIITQNCLRQLECVDTNEVIAEAGVSCASMARFCARNNLADGEFWAGIPGTMGGALRMNAGCHNGETWRYIKAVKTINRQGHIRWRNANEFKASYRKIEGLAENEWFVAARCKLPPGAKSTSLETIKQLLAHRSNTQPTSEYNCGSVFQNPGNDFAARLIENCGLKGFRIGGAQVSAKHANFIINDQGHASASDIEQLICHVHKTVLEHAQVNLIREVLIIGE